MTGLFAALLLAQADPLLQGQLPEDPARTLVQTKCMICHTGEYVTQQRLSEGAWKKTVEKMRKFGSPVTDEEQPALVAYLAKHWTTTLGAPIPTLAPLPAGSVPKGPAKAPGKTAPAKAAK